MIVTAHAHVSIICLPPLVVLHQSHVNQSPTTITNQCIVDHYRNYASMRETGSQGWEGMGCRAYSQNGTFSWLSPDGYSVLPPLSPSSLKHEHVGHFLPASAAAAPPTVTTLSWKRATRSFSRVVIICHHHDPPTTTLESECICSFSRMFALCHYHLPPTSKTSIHTCFRHYFLFFNVYNNINNK